MSFKSLISLLSPTGVWFTFAAISGVAALFVFTCLPETKGLTLEEVYGRFKGQTTLVQIDYSHLESAEDHSDGGQSMAKERLMTKCSSPQDRSYQQDDVP